jgi:hypothetical protein
MEVINFSSSFISTFSNDLCSLCVEQRISTIMLFTLLPTGGAYSGLNSGYNSGLNGGGYGGYNRFGGIGDGIGYGGYQQQQFGGGLF